ncbi:MAG: hypothetical protein ACJAQT_001054 [Akkermansiaceae bacterium]|jgi:hypothetical protein
MVTEWSSLVFLATLFRVPDWTAASTAAVPVAASYVKVTVYGYFSIFLPQPQILIVLDTECSAQIF